MCLNQNDVTIYETHTTISLTVKKKKLIYVFGIIFLNNINKLLNLCNSIRY